MFPSAWDLLTARQGMASGVGLTPQASAYWTSARTKRVPVIGPCRASIWIVEVGPAKGTRWHQQGLGGGAIRGPRQVQRAGRAAREVHHQPAAVAGVGVRSARRIERCSVLELGCGTGMLWQVNAPRVPASWSLASTDSSEGMLAESRRRLDGLASDLELRIMDAQETDFPDRAFDIVIANHLLYHLPRRERRSPRRDAFCGRTGSSMRRRRASTASLSSGR